MPSIVYGSSKIVCRFFNLSKGGKVATVRPGSELSEAHGFAYADNLEFLASDFDKAEKAEACRHVISYPKSWGYSTDTVGQKTCRRAIASTPTGSPSRTPVLDGTGKLR